MNKFKSLVLVCATLFVFGCADEELKPIITFDDAGKGAYVALVESTGGDIMVDNLAGSTFNYTVEFVDLQGGSLVAEYRTEVSFTDFDDSDGDSSTGPVALQSYSSSDFSPQGEFGNAGVGNITVTGTDLINALGLTADDLAGGGQFDVAGTVTTTDGQVFTANNSSPTVNGAGFRGFFDYTLFVVCPSELGGTYSGVATGTSTDPCCPDETTVNADITLTATAGGGEYTISDWSGGLYFEWYDVYGINGPSDTEGDIKDACTIITLLTDGEPFGESLKGSGKANADGTVNLKWSNGYGDQGTLVLTPK
ncbi:MAG: hypothetical protein KTR24_16755 [Saprospiraceae bacterium]|nr:hypothetical protein [Saprospiraceae bacterium]